MSVSNSTSPKKINKQQPQKQISSVLIPEYNWPTLFHNENTLKHNATSSIHRKGTDQSWIWSTPSDEIDLLSQKSSEKAPIFTHLGSGTNLLPNQIQFRRTSSAFSLQDDMSYRYPVSARQEYIPERQANRMSLPHTRAQTLPTQQTNPFEYSTHSAIYRNSYYNQQTPENIFSSNFNARDLTDRENFFAFDMSRDQERNMQLLEMQQHNLFVERQQLIWEQKALIIQSSQTSGRRRHSRPLSEPIYTARSPLLEQFRNSKQKNYELKNLVGHIVEFSGDQHGSRLIQQKLETASGEEKEMVFEEMLPNALQLMTDVFGNYVLQKFFEHGNQMQKTILAKQMEGNVVLLSLQMYGCRVVQKALEYVLTEQQTILIKELEGCVLKCIKDQNGNHVIQKVIERAPTQNIQFIIDAFQGQAYYLSTHPYGCRVIQRILEHSTHGQKGPLLKEIDTFTESLIKDQYGNYVIQHILERGEPKDKANIIKKILGRMLLFSKHKFASNVVEKCVNNGEKEDIKSFVNEVIDDGENGVCPLILMMKDQYANYVVQRLLDVVDESQREVLMDRIKPHLLSLKKYSYGKNLIQRVENLSILQDTSTLTNM
ncbi:hypothetical protein G6F56_004714 [Rhizopus delemar]|nr:hypothetical protein G6F56_004714 [Rhizopus delemar]